MKARKKNRKRGWNSRNHESKLRRYRQIRGGCKQTKPFGSKKKGVGQSKGKPGKKGIAGQNQNRSPAYGKKKGAIGIPGT